jgi:hypothetical protein
MEKITFDRILSTGSKNLIEIVLEDYDLDGNDFMGKVEIPLVSLKDRKERREWFPLENKDGTNDGQDRGALLLGVLWSYDVKAIPPEGQSAMDALNEETPARKMTLAPAPKKKKRAKTVVAMPKVPQPTLLDTYGNWEE